MLTGPKINAGVETPSRGLVLTCRGEKFTVRYNKCEIQCLHVELLKEKRCGTSLHYGLMFKSDCHVSHKQRQLLRNIFLEAADKLAEFYAIS
jgi:hypothetical protein